MKGRIVAFILLCLYTLFAVRGAFRPVQKCASSKQGGSCKTFFDGRVERVDHVDLDAGMFQMAHGVA